MRRLMFGVITFMFIFCTASAAWAQPRAEGPCENKPPPDLTYHAEMKVMPPGKYTLSYTGDRAQFDDASTPVVVRGLTGITSSKERSAQLSCAEVESRTARSVRALVLRWAVTKREADGSLKADAEVLSKGLLPPVYAEVAPGERKKVDLTGAYYADFMQPVATAGEPTGAYNVTIGVARVEFTDGTFIDLP